MHYLATGRAACRQGREPTTTDTANVTCRACLWSWALRSANGEVKDESWRDAVEPFPMGVCFTIAETLKALFIARNLCSGCQRQEKLWVPRSVVMGEWTSGEELFLADWWVTRQRRSPVALRPDDFASCGPLCGFHVSTASGRLRYFRPWNGGRARRRPPAVVADRPRDSDGLFD